MPINVAAVDGFRAMGIDLWDDHPGDLPPEYRAWLERGAALTARDVTRDQVLRSEVFDAVQGVFATHDLLVCPTVCALPVENGTDRNTVGPREVEGVEVDPLIGWCPTYLINFTGHPAVSLPAGLADGLPVGLQVVGRRHADADVLAAAAAFERARPWSAIYEVPAGRSVG